ncbi:MAG: hypothetical protein Kapaf2KO_14750 [Candidatus Kapaibacteriales bacterium]
MSRLLLIFLPIGLIFAGCAEKVKLGNYPADELLVMALKDYGDENYDEAKEKLDVIKLQYPSSQYADDAQFYIAMVHFQKEEFILSTYAFNRVPQYYPGSEYSIRSAYMAAVSQAKLSPKYFRDQEYTKKAIKAFQEFQYLFPGQDSLYGLASKQIVELRSKLAEKDFRVAEQYEILDSPKSAIIYYDAVMDDYPDTRFYEAAFVGKINSLVRLRKYDDALSLIDLYKQKFMPSDYTPRVDELRSTALERKKEAREEGEDSESDNALRG